VNVAAKLAQDAGQFGVIQLTAEAARRAGMASGQPRRITVGGLSVETVVL
jgi:hypothetical protein